MFDFFNPGEQNFDPDEFLLDLDQEKVILVKNLLNYKIPRVVYQFEFEKCLIS